MPITLGQRGAFPQPIGYGEDGNGLYSEVRYEGTAAEIAQLIPQLRSVHATWKITKSFTGAKDTIEARIPSPVNLFGNPEEEQPVNDWELMSNDVEKDLLESDIDIVNNLTDNEKLGLSQYMQDPGPDTFPASEPGSDYEALVKQVQRGLRSVEVSAPSLRHTMTVSKNYSTKATFTNVGAVYTPAKLIELESVPTSLLFDPPTLSTDREDVIWGYLKKFPTIRVSAGNKMQIEQEWKFNLWSTLIYPVIE